MNKINISPGFKRYFANTSWLMGHCILSMIVALLSRADPFLLYTAHFDIKNEDIGANNTYYWNINDEYSIG